MRPSHYPLSGLLLALFTLFSIGSLSAQINPCNFDAGVLTTEDGGRVIRVCLDDDDEGLTNVIRTGFVGGQSQWFITTSGGVILEVPAGGPPFDLTAYGERTLAIWSVAFSGELTDINVGDNVCNSGATECFDLSNAVAVARRTGDDCEVECNVMAGEIALTDGGGVNTSICIDDGASTAIDVTLTGTITGENSTFLITSSDGEILGIPGGSGPFDLSGAGVGTCIIWYLAYDDGLEGLTVGSSADDLEGCFVLSNPITVDRFTGDDCPANFTASINGVNEVPNPVTSTGNGTLNATIQGSSLTVSGSFSDLTSDFDPNVAGGAHLHLGFAGQGGPIAIRLVSTLDNDLRGGSFAAADNTFELTDEQAAAFRARGMYVNIHTLDFPAGEIRGQLVPAGADSYSRAYLLGVNEVPSIITPALGGVVVERTGNEITVSGSFSGLTGAIATQIAGGAHIHTGVVGRNGPVIIPLAMDIADDQLSAVFPADDNVYTLTAEQADALDGNGLYVNVHSATFPSGELRGQVTDMSTTSFYADLSGHQEQPAPVNTDGNGRVQINLDGNTITVFGSVDDLSDEVLVSLAGGAHLHLGLAGQSGPVNFPMTINLDDDNQGGTWSATANTFTLTDDQLDALFARSYYVNVHTPNVTSGEVRGQVMNLAKGYFGSVLAGENAKPFAVETSGTGFMMYELAGSKFVATGSFRDLSSDFDANIAGGSHIHVGNSAVSGPIVFGLNGDIAADLRSGVYQAEDNTFTISPAGSTSAQTGQYYFNLHTTANPSGEIRGQILRDDNAYPSAPVIETPADGETVIVYSGTSSLTGGTFDAATDPNDDALVYLVEFIAGAGTPDSVRRLYTIGPDTTVDRSLDAVYDTLVSLGAFNGVTLEIEYRVLSSDGSVSTPGEFRSVFLELRECETDGGVLSLADGGGDMITICAGDGVDDFFDVVLTDTVGTNFTYVITDGDGLILGLPADQPFNLEGAGGGACLIWALSFEDGLAGAEVGLNATGLTGCFDLSNPITVNRLTGDDCDGMVCDVSGGTITIDDNSTEITICAGDGISDAFNVIITGFSGDSSTFVVTDQDLNILALPATGPIDLEGAGGGTCLVWYLAYDSTLTGLAVGENVANLQGCRSLSNMITVIRNTGDDCMPGFTSGIVINEVAESGLVEFTNGSGPAFDLGNLFINDGITRTALSNAFIDCGDLDMKPGDITVLDLSALVNTTAGELALESIDLAGNVTLQSYVAWGTGNLALENTAIAAGLWSADFQLDGPSVDNSIQRVANLDFPTYGLSAPTLCEVNQLTVGNNNPTAGESLRAYPNPFTADITIAVEGLKASSTTLQLIDITGRVMSTQQLEFRTGRISMDAQRFSAGTYLVRLTNEAGVSTTRVVKR